MRKDGLPSKFRDSDNKTRGTKIEKKKRTLPKLKNTLTKLKIKYQNELIDEMRLYPNEVRPYREVLKEANKDLDEIIAICEERGRY